MGIIYNRKDQTKKRKNLRNSMPQAEIVLWNQLKGKKIKGLKFRRQYSVGKYVIDFYCTEIKLAIEADGDTHNSDDEIEYDRKRQSDIEIFGIRFLRIRNDEIFENIEEIIKKIEKTIVEMKK